MAKTKVARPVRTNDTLTVPHAAICALEEEIGRAAGLLSGVVTGLRLATPGIPSGASEDERATANAEAWFIGVLEGAIEEQIAVLKDQEAALFRLRAQKGAA